MEPKFKVGEILRVTSYGWDFDLVKVIGVSLQVEPYYWYSLDILNSVYGAQIREMHLEHTTSLERALYGIVDN